MKSFIGLIVCLLFLPVAASGAVISLKLSWTDNSNNEDGFGIERKIGAAYGEIARTAANVTSYTDGGLLQATTYCYRVFAFNAAGNSAYSNEACATTPSLPQPPNALTLTLEVK